MPGLKLLDRSLVREPHFSGLDCQAATKPVEQCLAKIRNASLGLISNVKKTYSSTRCFPKTHSAIRGFHRAFHRILHCLLGVPTKTYFRNILRHLDGVYFRRHNNSK